MRIGTSIPVNNNEDTIAQVIRSISSFTDVLVLINNDCTDNTLRIAKSIRPDVAVIDFPGKLWSFSDLKNTGIDYLDDKVDWILCCDGDDIIGNPDSVRSFLEQATADLIIGDVIFSDLIYKQARAFRTRKNIAFTGAVHEVLCGYSTEQCFPIQYKPLQLPKAKLQEPSIKRNIRIGENISNPTSRDLYYLANSYREDEQYSKAIETYNKYLPISTYHDEKVSAFTYRSKCYRSQKKFNEAIVSGLQGLQVDQRFAELYLEIAYSYFELGEYHKCMAFCDIASSLKIPDTQFFIEKTAYTSQPLITKGWCLIKLAELR